MTKKSLSQATGLLQEDDPEIPRVILNNEGSRRSSIAGSVMDNISVRSQKQYDVVKSRWFILGIFVVYSASNSAQWIQYTIIQDIVVKYYEVSPSLVAWTSMIYMITYIPLILVGSWFLDKTVSDFVILFISLFYSRFIQ